MKKLLIILVIVLILCLSIFSSKASDASSRSPFSNEKARPQYPLAMLLNELTKMGGPALFDIEQGQFSPRLDRFHLDSQNYLDSFQELLGTRDYAYEMRGSVMVIYDKKLRSLGGNLYPLNLTISSLRMNNVSLEQCFKRLSEHLHINIIYGDTMAFTPSKLRTNFDIDLNNVTLRKALFQIVSKSNSRTWNTSTFTIGNKQFLRISIW
jgi:hypothetical protein